MDIKIKDGKVWNKMEQYDKGWNNMVKGQVWIGSV